MEDYKKYESTAVYCNVSVNAKLDTVIADRSFYDFVGKDRGTGILDLVVPEEKELLKNMIYSTPKGKKNRGFIHMSVGEYGILPIDVTVDNCGHVYKGEELWDICFYDVYTMELKFLYYFDVIKKYRTMLEMNTDYLYDYDKDKDELSIYRYMSLNSMSYIKSSISDFAEKTIKNYSDDIKAMEFKNVLSRIAEASVDFVYHLSFPDPDNMFKPADFIVEGRVIELCDGSRMVAGVIHREKTGSACRSPVYRQPEGRDCFTGLLNKTGSESYAVSRLASSLKAVHYFIMIDIDNFKSINDTYGHLFGDQVILDTAIIIKKCLGKSGVAGHFGGDEFIIFTEEIENDLQLRMLLTSIRQQVSDHMDGLKPGCKITLSIGASRSPDNGYTYERLFLVADQCLYLAKRKGRNRYIIYDEKKHGIINQDVVDAENHQLLWKRTEHRTTKVSELVIDIVKKGNTFIEEYLERICSLFMIDGVRIYSADSKECLYCHGDYEAMPDMKSFLENGQLKELIGNDEYLPFGDISYIKVKNEQLYDELNRCKVKGILCCNFTAASGRDMYFFYDVIANKICWTDNDKTEFTVISKVLASVL